MKQTFALLFGLVAAIAFSAPLSAAEPDAPGSKLITVQGGALPGFGGLLTGQIALTDLGAGHLYGGLQLGANFRHGAATDVRKTDLSLAPRILYGFNLGRVVEIHFGGLAGIAVEQFTFTSSPKQSQLGFCYGGFGGFRLNFSPGFGIVLEGCYSPHLPYATAGLAFRF